MQSTRQFDSIVADLIDVQRVSTDHCRFDDVRQIRADAYGLSPREAVDAQDEYSEIWLALVGGRPSGTLRITRASQGKLDCEEHFPASLLNRFRSQIASANRFCLDPALRQRSGVASALISAAWKLGLMQGVRLDVIDVNAQRTGYYTRLGYHAVVAPTFTHPLLRTRSVVMAFTTEPWRPTPLQRLFVDIADPITTEDIRPWLSGFKRQPAHL